ncbi:hypothetical protein ACTA71_011477 [Dictyostelium dimigraforme]
MSSFKNNNNSNKKFKHSDSPTINRDINNQDSNQLDINNNDNNNNNHNDNNNVNHNKTPLSSPNTINKIQDLLKQVNTLTKCRCGELYRFLGLKNQQFKKLLKHSKVNCNYTNKPKLEALNAAYAVISNKRPRYFYDEYIYEEMFKFITFNITKVFWKHKLEINCKNTFITIINHSPISEILIPIIITFNNKIVPSFTVTGKLLNQFSFFFSSFIITILTSLSWYIINQSIRVGIRKLDLYIQQKQLHNPQSTFWKCALIIKNPCLGNFITTLILCPF